MSEGKGVGAVDVTVAVRVKPGAKRTAVGGTYPGPYGPAVVIAVTTRAVDGAATHAAQVAFAAALGIKPTTVMLRSGRTSRDKLFVIAPAPHDLHERITQLAGQAGVSVTNGAPTDT